MKLPQTGGCQCGKIRYEIAEEPRMVYTCHCVDCQRLTGSAFSLGIVVADAAFRLMGIEPRGLQRTADSGRTNTRLVCPECGSWNLRHAKGWGAPYQGGHSRRYILAPSDQAHLDPQQTALDRDARRQRDLRERRRCVKGGSRR
jgi:hypothetical protein